MYGFQKFVSGMLGLSMCKLLKNARKFSVSKYIIFMIIIYIFCSYFKFDDRYRRKYDGFPKPKAAPWLGCGRVVPK